MPASTHRVTAELRVTIRTLFVNGLTPDGISALVKLPVSTVRYHAVKSPRVNPRVACISAATAGKRALAARRRQKVKDLAREIEVLPSGKQRPRFPTAQMILNHMKVTGGLEELATCGKRTIIRDLHEAGLVSRVRPKVPTTRVHDEARREEFCRYMLGTDAHQLLFSDEKIYTINDNSSRKCWVLPGERPCGRERSRYSCKVQVWACIGKDFLTWKVIPNPVNPCGSINESKVGTVDTDVYVNELLPLMVSHCRRNNLLFLQDGASCHTSHRAKQYMEKQKVDWLDDWPARSPDLNPIEKFWAMTQPHITALNPTNYHELVVAINHVFRDFKRNKKEQINALCKSFETSVEETLMQRGRHA